MLKKQFYISILKKFILVSISYILMITLLFCYKNITLTQQNEHYLAEQLTASIGGELNNTVNLCINVSQGLVFDDRMKEFSLGDSPYWEACNIQKMITYFASLYSSNSFEIMVYNPVLDMVVTGNSSGDRKFLQSLLDISQEQLEDIFNHNTTSLFLTSSEGKLTVINHKTYESGKELYVFTNLNINSLLQNATASEYNLVLFHNDNMIARISNEAISSDKQLQTRYLFKLNYIQDKMELLLERSPLSVSAYLKYIFSSELLFIIPLLLISSLLILVLSRHTYRPVKDLLEVLGLSSEQSDEIDEFKKVENYLNVIKKNNMELNSYISLDNTNLQRESMLRDLFYGVYDTENIHNKLVHLGLNPSQTVYVLFVCEIVLEKHMYDSLNDALRINKLQTLSLFKDMLAQETTFQLFELNGMRFGGVVFDACPIKDILDKVVNTIYLSNQVNIKTEWKIIDAPLKDIGASSFSLLEHLGMDEEQKKELSTSYYYPSDIEDILIDATISGNAKYKDSLLDMILYENLNNRTLSHDNRNAFILSIAATIQTICSKENVSLDTVFEDGKMILLYMKSTSDNKTLSRIVKEYFNTIQNYLCLNANDKAAPEDTLSNIHLVEYIHQNYKSDISLNDIADNFNVTSSYMSYVFKAQTGRNFKDYLNWYRIEKAQEILKINKEIKISAVPEMVGCNNMQTFLRIFKKYTGMTPNDFQKK